MKILVPFLFALLGAMLTPAPASSQTATVNLSWGASATAGVDYNVYQENASGACAVSTPVAGACVRLNSAPISALTFTATPALGSQYWFVVRAVNSNGIESPNSNEAPLNLTAPAPPGTLTCTITIVNGVAAGTCK